MSLAAGDVEQRIVGQIGAGAGAGRRCLDRRIERAGNLRPHVVDVQQRGTVGLPRERRRQIAVERLQLAAEERARVV